MKSLRTRISVLILLCAVSNAALSQTPALDVEERALLAVINRYRAQKGIAPLDASITLSRAARWMSRDMAANDHFARDHTDSRGRSMAARMAAFDYRYNVLRGENIAAGHSSASATFEQWKNSPGHDRNMLDPRYRAIGIGRAFRRDSTFQWYWTADFGGYPDSR